MFFAYPIEFFPNSTSPKNPALFEAVQQFCVEEFGERQNLWEGVKTWAVVEPQDDGTDRILGISTFRLALDIPRFHVKAAAETGDAEKDRAARDEARAARDMLTARMWGFAQDTYGAQRDVFVFIDPKAERFWKSYLRLIRAKPANRYILTV